MIKKIEEKIVPIIKVGMVTSPEAPGMKNPTTLEANNIFDKSIKYFEIFSNCNLFNLNIVAAIYYNYF
jgi:hypothetical protein